tara:strand:+ start:4141 stop:6213 length:2073 start_codon:yes stop_codon:yes gene_type:complete
MELDLLHEFTTSISGKLRNTTLAKNRALWSIFEVISNSIDAIEERFENESHEKGTINISITRSGKETFVSNPEIDTNKYPITGFIISDNGIGLNIENYASFLTSDSEKKIEKGARGIGRFVCLKAFDEIHYDSRFFHNNLYYTRKFDFKAQGNGIFNPDVKKQPLNQQDQGTTITLNRFNSGYEKWIPRDMQSLGLRIIEHFVPYFLSGRVPKIILTDVNGANYHLNRIYETSVVGKVITEPFEIDGISFTLSLLKLSAKGKETHHIYFCGNDREVLDRKLSDSIPDMEYQINESGVDMIYKAYVLSPYLDDHINPERTGFTFSLEEDDDDTDSVELSFKKIKDSAIKLIEELLSGYLQSVRTIKVEEYTNHIHETAPQFNSLIKYKSDKIENIRPGLKGSALDVELFKIQQELEVEVKVEGEKLFDDLMGVENYEEYNEKYHSYIERLNETGKTQLAKYLIHRKSVIDLLDRLLGMDDNNKFEDEDTIHSIFFPLKKLSDEVPFNQQNLWLLDERLTYHSYLTSDKPLSSNENIETHSNDRPDLLIFKHKFSFVKDKEWPYQGFVVVEFKKPERANYSVDWEKKNPVDQVLKYIKDIKDSKALDRNGKAINFKEGAYFYAFIVCDFNNNLIRNILELRGFTPMPDGERYSWFNPQLKAMVEVVSYQQVLSDARKRNNILFDKLGINQRN